MKQSRYSEVQILGTYRLARAGIEPSVSSIGDSYGNAVAETINGLCMAELIHRRSWKPIEAIELATITWVNWFNNRPILEPISDITLSEAEKQYYSDLEKQPMAA